MSSGGFFFFISACQRAVTHSSLSHLFTYGCPTKQVHIKAASDFKHASLHSSKQWLCVWAGVLQPWPGLKCIRMFLSWRAVKGGRAAWGGVFGSRFGGADWADRTSTWRTTIKWILIIFFKKNLCVIDFRLQEKCSDVLQVRANVNTLFDDRQVLVKWKAIDGLVCQLQQLQPVLFPL